MAICVTEEMEEQAARSVLAAKDFEVRFTGDIDEVEPQWRALAKIAPVSPFQSFGAMRLFLEVAARNGASPVVATVSLAGGARPVAIFAMTRARKGPFTTLTLADLGIIDYGVPLLDTRIVGPENIDAVMAALMRAAQADYLYINKIPQSIAGRANPMAASANRARLMLSGWPIPLDGRYAGEVVPRQSSGFKKQMSRYMRKMEREYDRRFEIFVGPQVTEEHFSLLQRMRRDWFQTKGRHDVVNDPAWQDFYHGLARGEGGDTQPWIATLSADGEVVAVDFGLLLGRQAIALLKASQGGDWKRFKPGIQLFEEEIRWFEANGAVEFDLSIGDNPFKFKFAPDCNPLYDAVFPGSAKGWAYLAFWRLKTRVRNSEWIGKLRARIAKSKTEPNTSAE